MLRLLFVLIGCFLTAISPTALAGVLADADLDLHVVRILRTLPADISKVGHTGNAGVLLGKGLVLTAAHVIGGAPIGAKFYVLAGDRLIEAHVVRAGDYGTTDVSVLALDAELLPDAMREAQPLLFCEEAPREGQAVRVAEYENMTSSVIVGRDILPPGIPENLTTFIKDVYTTGNSGSGVFDAQAGCLMGIMSRKVERTSVTASGEKRVEGIAKYFVPAADIRPFIGDR
jgi:hypothetical protein